MPSWPIPRSKDKGPTIIHAKIYANLLFPLGHGLFVWGGDRIPEPNDEWNRNLMKLPIQAMFVSILLSVAKNLS
jgi:hypothetical protein